MYEVLREVATNPKTAGLSSGEKNVLNCLAAHADKDGTRIYPNLATIVQWTNLSRYWVRMAIKKLIKLGFIVRLTSGRGRSQKTYYRIPLNQFGHFEPTPPPADDESFLDVDEEDRYQTPTGQQERAARLRKARQQPPAAASSRQPAAARGEELASEEEPFLDVEEDEGQQPPAVASASVGTRLLQLVGRAPAAAGRDQDYVMPLASGMAVSSLPQSLPTTPLPGPIIVDAIPSPQPGGAGEELTTADPLSPLEQEIADLEQQEKDAVWDLSWRYPNKIDKRRREVEEDLRAIRSQLTMLRQELKHEQESEHQAAAGQQYSEVML